MWLALLLFACAPKPSAVGGPGTTPATGSGTYGPAPMEVARTPDQASIEGVAPVRTPSGLTYWVLREGAGPVPAPGDVVYVHYTGWLATGRQFDSSHDRGQPLEFVLGEKRVIAGWEEAVATMKVGERRRLEIPPSLGYGAAGAGPIPPGATLVFEVELVRIGGR